MCIRDRYHACDVALQTLIQHRCATHSACPTSPAFTLLLLTRAATPKVAFTRPGVWNMLSARRMSGSGHGMKHDPPQCLSSARTVSVRAWPPFKWMQARAPRCICTRRPDRQLCGGIALGG
eukprot:9233944-Alexandrium_andersonii.AAC.1